MSQNLTLLMRARPFSPDTVTLAQGQPGGGAGRAAGRSPHTTAHI